MKTKLYALALAAMLAVSMSAFAGDEPKSCNNADAKYCEVKDRSCCKDADKCDKAKCEKKCEKKADKKAS